MESIAAEGWPGAVLVAVVRSFCREAAVYYRACRDGRVDDVEAREIVEATGRFFADLERACATLYAAGPGPSA